MNQPGLEDIVSLAKRRGFVYQGSEIYGGLAGTWDYGPLGALLKRNIVSEWLKFFVDGFEDMYQIDSAILMNPKVWQASGHVDTFTDPLIECNHCNGRFRADHLIDNKEEYNKESGIFFAKREALINSFADREYGNKEREELYDSLRGAGLIVGEGTYPAHDTVAELRQFYVSKAQQDANRFLGDFPAHYLNEHHIKCPRCGNVEWYPARTFNMMFKTQAGPVESEENTVYLRPETAQGMFANYKNILDTFYPDLPFGVAQVGKAFRNEISPRDFLFRVREFEIMEFEYFLPESLWEAKFEKWRGDMHKWFKHLGLAEDKIKEIEVSENDRAHYSKRTVDFEYDFPSMGFSEVGGLAYRTDYDLKNHQQHSGKNMEYRPKDGSQPFIPHVIEPTFGVDRNFLAVLSQAYSEDEQGGEKRVFLKLPSHLAPVKAAIFPLLKNKPELVNKAKEVHKMLRKQLGGEVMFDDNGNIGKRYRRQDEIGTPYCITIDFQTLEDDTVTLRSRDTTQQERVKTDDLPSKF